MNKHALRALKELHEQLRNAELPSDSDRDLVKHLQNDIEKLLANAAAASAMEHQSLIKDLQEAAQRFEVSHPQLTAVIGRVVDSLSAMGI